MNRAFIFDMDGVLVNSEHAWTTLEEPMLRRVLGAEIAEKFGNTIGIGLIGVIKRAAQYDPNFDKDALIQGYEDTAVDVYAQSPITSGVEALAQKLLSLGFKLGLVTQSPQTWIDQVVPRLPFKESLEAIISLNDRKDLREKPAPDGYQEALRLLGASAERSIVLEDSNFGIMAAKAAGAFTIGYRGNLVDGYEQTGADEYADTMEEVGRIVATRP
ncbi:MAG: HAD family phosphatase [Candidatus Kaiserbacteria bacterium]|nr:MAG: HAD family phosphatase [Candidatus Kaiserbacteria bacterium]